MMTWDEILRFLTVFGGTMLYLWMTAAIIIGAMWVAKRLGLFSDD